MTLSHVYGHTETARSVIKQLLGIRGGFVGKYSSAAE